MSRRFSKWVIGCVVCATVFTCVSETHARYNTGAYRRYIAQQQKMYQQQMIAEQKMMMMMIAQQQAIEKHKAENRAKASKAQHDKEAQHRQDMIAKRKTEQSQASSRTAATSK